MSSPDVGREMGYSEVEKGLISGKKGTRLQAYSSSVGEVARGIGEMRSNMYVRKM